MAYADDDFSDILGQSSLPIRPEAASGWTSPSFILKWGFWFLLACACFFVGSAAWEAFLKWREKTYRLSMRRKHGIPDNDHRPFHVAYREVEAAKKAREERALYSGARRESELRRRPALQQTPQAKAQLGMTPERLQARGSLPGALGTPSSGSMPPIKSLYPQAQSSLPTRVTFIDGYNTSNTLVSPTPPVSTQAYSSVPGPSSILKPSTKRAFLHADDDAAGTSKKTRIEGQELIDGEEDAGWDQSQTQKGSKRVHGEVEQGSAERPKRPRKVSREKAAQNEDMDVDVDETPASRRGRKRDRQPDEDDEEAAEEDKAKGRKRRNKRRSDVHLSSSARGKKREREAAENEESEEEGVVERKKGKRSQPSPSDEEEEDLMDMDSSPLKHGREIGDTWVSHGTKYKIGPNGQRLREALVKAEHRFQMPEDSTHPDKTKNIDIAIVTWLTEEEYQEAKAQYLLVGQEDPAKTPSEPQSPVEEVKETPPPPQPKGKRLLWDATEDPLAGSATANPFSTSSSPATQPFPTSNSTSEVNRLQDSYRPIASTIGLRSNSGGFNRRISLGFPSLADSTNTAVNEKGTPARRRFYSKLEKQELEAKGMLKIREERERLEREKQVKAAPPAVPTIQSAPVVPTITLTKPEEKKDARAAAAAGDASKFTLPGATTGQKPSSFFNLAPSSAASSDDKKEGEQKKDTTPSSAPVPTSMPTFAFPGAPASSASKPQEKPKLPGFGLPSTMTTPAASSPAAPAPIATAAPSPQPPFSFAKPAEAPKPTISAPPAPSSGPPKFSFSVPKPGAAAAPSAPQPQNKDAAGAPSTAPTPASTGSTPIFAFPKPAAAAAPSTPTKNAASTTPAGTPTAGPKLDFKNPAQPSATLGAAPGASSGLKFSFNTGARKDPSPASTGAPTTAEQKTAPAAFTFNSGAATSGSGGPSSFQNPFSAKLPATDVPAAPSPFGAKPSAENVPTNPFGAKPAQNAPANPFGSVLTSSPFGAKPADNPAPSPFGGAKPAENSSAPNPFGAKPAESAPNPFGVKPAEGSAPAPSPFGAKPAEKSSFSFGAPAAASGSSEAPKSAFGGFGTPSTSEKKDEVPKSAFGTPTPAPSGSSTPAFGFGPASNGSGPSTSAFSFGKPAEADKAKTSTPTAFSFGSTPAATTVSGEAPKPAFGSTPATSSDAPKPAFSFTSGATTSAPTFGTSGGGTFTFGNPSSSPSTPSTNTLSLFGSTPTGSAVNIFGSSTPNPFGGSEKK